MPKIMWWVERAAIAASIVFVGCVLGGGSFILYLFNWGTP